MAAGQLSRISIEQLGQCKHLGRLSDLLTALIGSDLTQLERKLDVLPDGFVRVQRIGLKDHRYVAMLRGDVIDEAVPDMHRPARNLFQAGNHPQQRGLAAAGGADQDDKLTIRDGEVYVGDHLDVAKVFVDVTEGHGGHTDARYCVGLLVEVGYLTAPLVNPFTILFSKIR